MAVFTGGCRGFEGELKCLPSEPAKLMLIAERLSSGRGAVAKMVLLGTEFADWHGRRVRITIETVD